MINKNQVTGVVKNLTGKVQEEAGKFLNNKEQETRNKGSEKTGRRRTGIKRRLEMRRSHI